ncbi:MAG: metallophosphoesterase family protein [Bacteroidota bacterium]
MRIGVISDIHDHIPQLQAALSVLKEEAIDGLICCGDLCSPFVMELLGKGFQGNIHLVFGNNDGDTYRITRTAQQWPERINLHGEIALFSLGGKKIAINHFDAIAKELAASGNFDLVCYGHNHRRSITRFTTRGHSVTMLNPGSLMGYRFDEEEPVSIDPTFAIVDLDEDNEVTFFELYPNAEAPHGFSGREIEEK